MTNTSSAADVFNTIQELHLLDRSQLDEVSRTLLPKSGDSHALAQTLVDRGWLTSFQTDKLLTGQGHELVLGPYHLIKSLGEGGMGQVFKAMHQRLRRVVALKVIRQERLSQDPEAVRRFHRESQAAAQLSHPNVVIVFDADQIDNTHFIAMEYVEGVDLARLVHDMGPLPVPIVCDYMRQAALGLQHAHERGFVHRDIKPSNLLVTQPQAMPTAGRFSQGLSGELPVPRDGNEPTLVGLPIGGVVKILDMGLVRLVNRQDSKHDSLQTQAGTVMGTPDYIAPEQARNPRAVDIRADLYSLGCTFYYLLCGRPPFAEGSMVEKLLMHQLDEPKPIEELRTKLPLAVCQIVRKLMSKRPDDRFQTPIELAEALNKLSFSDLATPILPSPKAAPAKRDIVETPSDQILAHTPLPIPQLAAPTPHPYVDSQDKQPTAFVHISPTPILPPRLREPEKPKGPEPAKQISLLKGHRGWVMSAAFTTDRNRLASGGVDGTIRLWGFSSNVPKEQLLPPFHQGEVRSLAFSPNTDILASGSGVLDGVIATWDVTGYLPKQKLILQGHKGQVEALVFSPDGLLMASASADKTARLWDMATGREKTVLKGHTDAVLSVAFTPDTKHVVTGSQDGTVRLWSLGRIWSTETAMLHGHSGPVRTVAVSANGKFLASSGGLDQTVRLWSLDVNSQPELLAVFEGHQSMIKQILFPIDGHSLLSIDDRGQIMLWNLRNTRMERDWPSPGMMVCSVAFTYDGRYLAIGKSDGNLAVFRLYPRSQSSSGSGSDP